jgi:hypothetical protein
MCYILRDGENLGKFDAKSDVSIFFGYFTTSQASWVYNLRTKTVMESVNVVIDDETTTDHLEEEEPHIEGEQAGIYDRTHGPPSPNVPAVSSTLPPTAKDENMPRSPIPNMVSHVPSSRVKQGG